MAIESNKIIPTLAFLVLKDAEENFKQTGKFSDDNLQSLYLLFGDVFEDATELLDRGRFILYRTDEGYREMIKVFRREEQYNLFIDINYCSCLFFTNQVLEARLAITCKHVLAAKLAQITKTTKMMGVTDTQFHQLLNDLIPDLK